MNSRTRSASSSIAVGFHENRLFRIFKFNVKGDRYCISTFSRDRLVQHRPTGVRACRLWSWASRWLRGHSGLCPCSVSSGSSLGRWRRILQRAVQAWGLSPYCLSYLSDPAPDFLRRSDTNREIGKRSGDLRSPPARQGWPLRAVRKTRRPAGSCVGKLSPHMPVSIGLYGWLLAWDSNQTDRSGRLGETAPAFTCISPPEIETTHHDPIIADPSAPNRQANDVPKSPF